MKVFSIIPKVIFLLILVIPSIYLEAQVDYQWWNNKQPIVYPFGENTWKVKLAPPWGE